MNNKIKNVIFFDGVCGFCNGFIDFIMKIDHAEKFSFSPLQSDYAKTHLSSEDTQNLHTVVVRIEGKTFRKSQAVFEVLNQLGGVWKLASVMKILPESLLNLGYDLVAENRYKMFGKKETCRIPTPEERQRFLL